MSSPARADRPRANPLRCERLEDRSLLSAASPCPLPAETGAADIGFDPALVDPNTDLTAATIQIGYLDPAIWGSGSSPAWAGSSSSSAAWGSSSAVWSSSGASSMFWTGAGSSSAWSSSAWSSSAWSSSAGSSASLSGVAYLGGPMIASGGDPLIASSAGGPMLDDGEAAAGDGGGWVRCGTESPDEVIATEGNPDDVIFYTMAPGADIGSGDGVPVPISAPADLGGPLPDVTVQLVPISAAIDPAEVTAQLVPISATIDPAEVTATAGQPAAAVALPPDVTPAKANAPAAAQDSAPAAADEQPADPVAAPNAKPAGPATLDFRTQLAAARPADGDSLALTAEIPAGDRP